MAADAVNHSTLPVSRRNAEHYHWGKVCDGWYLVKESTLHVIEEKLPPGTGETLHFHRQSLQFFYVLAGTATFTVGKTLVVAYSGEGISVIPEVAHRVENAGSDDLFLLVISQPPSHDDRIDANERK
jgi:mannose-6-phosphate isomerase-like protein (cupin superfamily)